MLLNIWATWCVPCREEMPALDKLETELGGKDFAVVAVNIDKGGPDKARGFLRRPAPPISRFTPTPGQAVRGAEDGRHADHARLDRDGKEIGRLDRAGRLGLAGGQARDRSRHRREAGSVVAFSALFHGTTASLSRR